MLNGEYPRGPETADAARLLELELMLEERLRVPGLLPNTPMPQFVLPRLARLLLLVLRLRTPLPPPALVALQ